MLVMLVITVVQRGIGFVRGIWFCRLLEDAQVGQWAMAFGFITLITPVVLLGLPGSLPRYVEHFRMRGHLSPFVSRLLIATVLCAGGFAAAMFWVPGWFAWLIFLEPSGTELVPRVAAAVLAIIAFHFVKDLNASLRQVHVVSAMQFVQSVGFTVLAVAWLSFGGGLGGVILVFASATLAAMLPGLATLWSGWSGLPKSDAVFDATAMWRRLLPYAAALWCMNLLGNLFELSDRYMILHFFPGEQPGGQAAVGQYHSGRIFPVLLISLSTMISGVLMPYLAADWEAGRSDAVRECLRRVLLGLSAAFTAGGAVVLWLAPWLFATLLEGRYDAGLSLMPMAFVFCSWWGLVIVGQDYLWVAEKGKFVGMALAVGLLANLALNAWLLPIWGLHGAVVATLIAHATVMVGVGLALARCDYRLDSTTMLVALLPATLLAGPVVAMVCLAVALAANKQARSWIREALAMLPVGRWSESVASP